MSEKLLITTIASAPKEHSRETFEIYRTNCTANIGPESVKSQYPKIRYREYNYGSVTFWYCFVIDTYFTKRDVSVNGFLYHIGAPRFIGSYISKLESISDKSAK